MTSSKKNRELLMEKQVTPLKAIRLKCLECSAGSRKEVRDCGVVECPLLAFRFGRNPQREKISWSKLEKSLKTASRSHELVQVAT